MTQFSHGRFPPVLSVVALAVTAMYLSQACSISSSRLQYGTKHFQYIVVPVLRAVRCARRGLPTGRLYCTRRFSRTISRSFWVLTVSGWLSPCFFIRIEKALSNSGIASLYFSWGRLRRRVAKYNSVHTRHMRTILGGKTGSFTR